MVLANEVDSEGQRTSSRIARCHRRLAPQTLAWRGYSSRAIQASAQEPGQGRRFLVFHWLSEHQFRACVLAVLHGVGQEEPTRQGSRGASVAGAPSQAADNQVSIDFAFRRHGDNVWQHITCGLDSQGRYEVCGEALWTQAFYAADVRAYWEAIEPMRRSHGCVIARALARSSCTSIWLLLVTPVTHRS